jgi:hypothetical protein
MDVSCYSQEQVEAILFRSIRLTRLNTHEQIRDIYAFQESFFLAFNSIHDWFVRICECRKLCHSQLALRVDVELCLLRYRGEHSSFYHKVFLLVGVIKMNSN